MYVKVNSCPLCSSTDFEYHSQAIGNLYSEKISAYLGILEAELLKSVYNMMCTRCSLIFKNQWFAKPVLDILFTELVPSHPKGWDAVSKRFSFGNFYAELEIFARALEIKDEENINRYKRALSSLLDSAISNSEQQQHQELFQAILNENPEFLKTKTVQDFLRNKFNFAAAYKRFSGFSDIHLWEYIKSKVEPMHHYDEVGCPLWGLLRHASQEGLDAMYLKREENNYWNSGCTQNGTHCSEYLSQLYPIKTGFWSNSEREKRDVLGFFQYLDHLNHPMQFLNEVFLKYKHAAIILDKVDEVVYIQHFTGFTSYTMQYIANRFNKVLHQDFMDIESSGNVMYLFSETNS